MKILSSNIIKKAVLFSASFVFASFLLYPASLFLKERLGFDVFSEKYADFYLAVALVVFAAVLYKLSIWWFKLIKFNFKLIKFKPIRGKLFFSSKSIKGFIKKSFSEGLPEEQIIAKLKLLGYEENRTKLNLLEIKTQIKEEQKSRERIDEGVFIVNEWEDKKRIVKSARLADLIFLALRIFKVKPARTILTILGIGVSFGVILFLVSLGYGLQRQILGQIASSDAAVTLDVFSPKQEILAINDKTIEAVAALPNVLKVSPVASLDGQAVMGNLSFETVFMGVSPDFKQNGALKILNGEFFDTEEKEEAVISSVFLKILNKTPAEIMKSELTLTYSLPATDQAAGGKTKIFQEKNKFKVVGVAEDENNNYIYLPFAFLHKLNLPSYSFLKVKVKEAKYLDEVRSKIIEQGFTVSTISDTIEQANKIFNSLQIILGLFGVAALIVAVIGMINTMTIALLERIQEIGIMKVIGAADKDIEKLFLFESLVIGFSGGLSGLVIGFLSSQTFNLGINFLAKALGGNKVNLFYYPPWFIVTIVIFASLVGLVTGAIPARRAGKMDPLQAIRYK